MDLKISDLKIGAKLVFGKYGVASVSSPIVWLKASNDGEFLSEFAIDYIKFDAVERLNPNRALYWGGNADYELSNINQFMNSCEENWYEPMHQYDSSPGTDGCIDRNGDYMNHAGFLHNFEDYEVDALAGAVELPTIANIYGAGGIPRFPLFNRRGLRARPTSDLVDRRYGHGLTHTSFSPFWLQDQASETRVCYVDRGGVKRSLCADTSVGFRPKCKIKLDVNVELLPDGSGYRIIPYEVSSGCNSSACTDDEFMAFMGLL